MRFFRAGQIWAWQPDRMDLTEAVADPRRRVALAYGKVYTALFDGHCSAGRQDGSCVADRSPKPIPNPSIITPTPWRRRSMTAW